MLHKYRIKFYRTSIHDSKCETAFIIIEAFTAADALVQFEWNNKHEYKYDRYYHGANEIVPLEQFPK